MVRSPTMTAAKCANGAQGLPVGRCAAPAGTETAISRTEP